MSAVLLCAFIASNIFGQQSKLPQQATTSKWIENKVDVRFKSGYLDDYSDIILTWVVQNRSGSDIEINFKESLLREPARVFLKLKSDQTAIRLDLGTRFLSILDNMIPEDLTITFRMRFPVPVEQKSTPLFGKKPTYQELLSKHMGNVQSIIIYIPESLIKITFPIPQ